MLIVMIYLLTQIGTQWAGEMGKPFNKEEEDEENDPELFQEVNMQAASTMALQKLKKAGLKTALNKILSMATRRQLRLKESQLRIKWDRPNGGARIALKDDRGSKKKGWLERYCDHFWAFFFRFSDSYQR